VVKDGHRLNCYLMLSPSCEPPQPTTENLRPARHQSRVSRRTVLANSKKPFPSAEHN
jgi:hypothetical protein